MAEFDLRRQSHRAISESAALAPLLTFCHQGAIAACRADEDASLPVSPRDIEKIPSPFDLRFLYLKQQDIVQHDAILRTLHFGPSDRAPELANLPRDIVAIVSTCRGNALQIMSTPNTYPSELSSAIRSS